VSEDARTIAARLGIDELAVRRLQARGHLLRLDLSEQEARERLLRANVLPLRRRAVGPRPTDEPPAAA
jgi:hypothetical protein